MRTSIETYTGRHFDYTEPRPEDIHISDIARGLSNTCRFNGLIKRYYSVAEHAVLVSELVRSQGHAPAVCYAALHHDSHEAYLGDVTTPLKNLLAPAGWERMQWRTDYVICRHLGIAMDLLDHWAIKEADADALRMEAAVLKPSQGVGPLWGTDAPAKVPAGFTPGLRPEDAEVAFIVAHRKARAAAGLVAA